MPSPANSIAPILVVGKDLDDPSFEPQIVPLSEPQKIIRNLSHSVNWMIESVESEGVDFAHADGKIEHITAQRVWRSQLAGLKSLNTYYLNADLASADQFKFYARSGIEKSLIEIIQATDSFEQSDFERFQSYLMPKLESARKIITEAGHQVGKILAL